MMHRPGTQTERRPDPCMTPAEREAENDWRIRYTDEAERWLSLYDSHPQPDHEE